MTVIVLIPDTEVTGWRGGAVDKASDWCFIDARFDSRPGRCSIKTLAKFLTPCGVILRSSDELGELTPSQTTWQWRNPHWTRLYKYHGPQGSTGPQA